MKGYDIFYRAITLLGYSDRESEDITVARLIKSAPDIISQISVDLKCFPVSSLSDEIEISLIKQDALFYGVAMLLALIDGDIELNRVFTNIYNSKRTTALSEIGTVKDNLPNVVMG